MLAYLNGLYLLDLLPGLPGRLASGLYRLEEIAPDHFRQSEYYLSYFHDNVLEDEVQFILQVPDRARCRYRWGCSGYSPTRNAGCSGCSRAGSWR